MDIKKIKELIDMMKANDLSEIEIEDGDTHIKLKRGQSEPVSHPHVTAPPVLPQHPAPPPPSTELPAATETETKDNLSDIKSPIVGTFYVAPSPDAKPFVEIGSKVDENTVVCIVEAMKVMNEIKSEVKGTIREICVKNGQAVEFGQPLFRVDPN